LRIIRGIIGGGASAICNQFIPTIPKTSILVMLNELHPWCKLNHNLMNEISFYRKLKPPLPLHPHQIKKKGKKKKEKEGMRPQSDEVVSLMSKNARRRKRNCFYYYVLDQYK
jgi:hypothetical protein